MDEIQEFEEIMIEENMNVFFTQFPTSGDIFDKQEKKEKKKFEKAKTFKVRQI
jgi:hypothetical protein